MGDLQVIAESAGVSLSHESSDSRGARLGRALRSGIFLFLYGCYAIVCIGLPQRLLLWPAIVLVPGRRRAIMRAWLRFQSRATLALARVLAGVRVTVRGVQLPNESCIVVMNHQSVFDIPLGLALVRGPAPIIPTRDRYRRGIPGISPVTRMAGFVYVSQKRSMTRGELAAFTDVADKVARGEHTLLIFPEGHRSRDGGIGKFMRNGLRITLNRGKRPVYCVVADGMAQTRTFADAFMAFAGSRVTVQVDGPFAPPAEDQVDDFIDFLHEHMTATFDRMRQAEAAQPTRAPITAD